MPVNTDINLHHIVITANLLCQKDDKYLFLKRSPYKIVAPNIIHFPGGKVDATEDPLIAAQRELLEETGLVAKNIKLGAVITDVHSLAQNNNPNDYLAFYFVGEYDSGDQITTEEGELLWLSPPELNKQQMYPSVSEVIDYILSPQHGTVFARFVYDNHEKITERQISFCAIS
ncbi:MAG: hypothetical protein KatS3mg087_0337 [Patescibacteria group bacterium]|nr:MAG: hypothetical protein KatS3mg087_0337 [Patescibacteria group bacterium]